MRTPERVALMQKYFTVYNAKTPSFSNIMRISIVTVLLGIFIIYFFRNSFLAGFILILFGLALFAIWIRPYFRETKIFKERPPVKQMYNWFVEDLNTKIKDRAVDTLRLNMKDLRAENFLLLPYPLYWNHPGVDPQTIMRRATEEKGIFIYSVWNVQVVALTKNYISFFNCIYDWLNDVILNERTNEFFYDDISSVKNDVKQIQTKFIDQGEEDEETQLTSFVFEVTNMSSDSLSVITKIPELQYSPSLEVNLEKAVQALRITLRKRRYDEDQDPIILEVEEKKEEDTIDNQHNEQE